MANVSDASDLNFSLEAFSLDLEKNLSNLCCVTVIRQMPRGQAMALEVFIVDAAHVPAPLCETIELHIHKAIGNCIVHGVYSACICRLDILPQGLVCKQVVRIET